MISSPILLLRSHTVELLSIAISILDLKPLLWLMLLVIYKQERTVPLLKAECGLRPKVPSFSEALIIYLNKNSDLTIFLSSGGVTLRTWI